MARRKAWRAGMRAQSPAAATLRAARQHYYRTELTVLSGAWPLWWPAHAHTTHAHGGIAWHACQFARQTRSGLDDNSAAAAVGRLPKGVPRISTMPPCASAAPRKWRPHSPSYPFTFIRPRGTHRSSCRVHAWMNASPRPRPHVGGWRGCLPLLARCFYISSFLPSSPSTNIIVTPFGVLESNASSTS